jgi:hypothetical protein
VDFEVQATPIGDGTTTLISVFGELDLGTCDQLAPITDDATAPSYAFTLHRAVPDADGMQIEPGIYTAFLAPTAAVSGTGYVTMTISKKRSARMAGRTGDAEPFSDGSKLFGAHYVLDPLLYKHGKTFDGQLRSDFEVTGATTIAGGVEWFKS